MRISYWISDVCSSDLCPRRTEAPLQAADKREQLQLAGDHAASRFRQILHPRQFLARPTRQHLQVERVVALLLSRPPRPQFLVPDCRLSRRSEEHTSELQSLMRISYAVFCLKKKK